MFGFIKKNIVVQYKTIITLNYVKIINKNHILQHIKIQF
jgi:hypothetical protein